MDRVILHSDLNAFYASVEELYHPEVKDKPMAVCGDADKRHGIILAKNELAKRAGVKTAEVTWEAMRKCPDLILLPPHHDLYEEYSQKVNGIYTQYTDLIEPVSIDESYLDVTGSQRLFGSGKAIADDIRRAVRAKVGLTVSVGVSFCKIFAKMGSDYKKPDATTVITRDNFRDILYPLPVTAMMGVGSATAKSLRNLGVETIGDLAALDKRLLARFGKGGETLTRYVQGLDNEPVHDPRIDEAPKSIGNSITYRRNLMNWNDITMGLLPLAESVGARLRAAKMKCSGVQVSIKNAELKKIERQVHLTAPTNLSRTLFDAAKELIKQNWEIGNPIRMLALTAINLVDADQTEQLTLFKEGVNEKEAKLEESLDEIRLRFGNEAVKRATLLKNDLI